MCAAHASPTPWVDFNSNGYSVAVRFDGSNVQCYSTDGVNCAWGTSAVNAAKDASARPLSCGAAHKAAWGSTGYDTSNHWCGMAYGRLYATWQAGTPKGIDTAIGLNPNGDPECYGTDGQSCAWGVTAPSSVSDASPLACGAMHQTLYGITGYGNIYHWCYLGYYAKKKFTTLPSYSDSVYYHQGDTVESGGHTYRFCALAGRGMGAPYAHLNCAAGNVWEDLGWAPGAMPQAAQWQTGGVYAKGDLVTYNGVLYFSIYGMDTTSAVSSYTPSSSQGLRFWRAL